MRFEWTFSIQIRFDIDSMLVNDDAILPTIIGSRVKFPIDIHKSQCRHIAYISIWAQIIYQFSSWTQQRTSDWFSEEKNVYDWLIVDMVFDVMQSA